MEIHITLFFWGGGGIGGVVVVSSWRTKYSADPETKDRGEVTSLNDNDNINTQRFPKHHVSDWTASCCSIFKLSYNLTAYKVCDLLAKMFLT